MPPSPEQRDAALAKANDHRMYRAELKRKIARGEEDIRAIILDPDERLMTCKVIDLLAAVPGVGHVKAETWLRDVHASSYVRFATFTERQRAKMLLHLNSWAHTSQRYIAKAQAERERAAAARQVAA